MLKKTPWATLAIAGLAAATLATATAPAQAQIRDDAYRGYHGPVYRYAGEDYCWYESAWRGSGWYLCGSQWRRGFGWGGRFGWHGWYTHPHHHLHHHPHGPRPQPGPGRPPIGGQPGPAKPPGGGQPGGPPSGGHAGAGG